MGELLSVSALLFFSFNIVLTKVAADRLDIGLGFLIALVFNILFALALLAGQLLLSGEGLAWSSRGFTLFLLAGFFSTYLGRWFFYDSVRRLGPARASTFQVSNPMFTVLFSWALLEEALNGLDLLAILAVLAGLYVVSSGSTTWSPLAPPDPGASLTAGDRFKQLMASGVLLALFGSLAYAIGNIVRGVAVRDWNEPIAGALLGALLGLTLHLLLNTRAADLPERLVGADRGGMYLFAISGLLTMAGQVCVISAMWYIPVSVANLITLSTPAAVTPLSLILLKNQESITLRTVLGIVMVLTGITALVLA